MQFPVAKQQDQFADSGLSAGLADLVNTALVLSFDALLFYCCGLKSLVYLLAGVVFGGGLHPLGGHLIAEHYMFLKATPLLMPTQPWGCWPVADAVGHCSLLSPTQYAQQGSLAQTSSKRSSLPACCPQERLASA